MVEERGFTKEGLYHPQDFGSTLLIVCHSCFFDNFSGGCSDSQHQFAVDR
uniref:Uncharacterized protein n=1 Tax=Nelumbo nucifera TaxID=4432 RepID=A0A822XZF7_NELNU|nr:TPA_asm: hypothetical protein HUJ06_026886 [Nelumbo nucifera]